MQRYMMRVIGEYIKDFVAVYLDDIIIFSNTKEDYIKYVKLVLEYF